MQVREHYTYVMVLEDGETYSDIGGCKIVRIDETPENRDDLDNGRLPTKGTEIVVVF